MISTKTAYNNFSLFDFARANFLLGFFYFDFDSDHSFVTIQFVDFCIGTKLMVKKMNILVKKYFKPVKPAVRPTKLK